MLREKEKGFTGEENPPTWTGEVLWLSGLADVGNVVEGIIEDKDLDEAGNSCGHHLGHEHSARGNLHVVAELEVRYKGQGLRHSNIAKGFEARIGVSMQGAESLGKDLHHQGQRTTWLNVTIDKLRQHIQANLVVRHSLDDANRQGEGKGNEHGQQKGPPCHVSGPSKDSKKAKGKHLTVSVMILRGGRKFSHTTTNSDRYHHVGASLYLRISFI